MGKKFKVPELGENVESATVADVLISEGDKVEADQAVVELETDKAVAEVPCDTAGTVEKVHVQKGDEVEVGQTLLTLSGDKGGEAESSPEQTDGKEPEAEEAEDEDEAEPQPGTSQEQEKEGDRKQEAAGEEPPEQEARGRDEEETEAVPAAPSVRRLAREIGVDLSTVSGSGPGGRITADDVKARARSGGGEGGRGRAAPSPEKLPDFSRWGEIERESMSKVRRLTAERMSRAWSTIPHAVQFGKADVTRVEQLRQQYKEKAREAGGHLSLTVVLLKTVASALKVFPRFNASVDTERNEIVYKKYYNIGVAMDTERGLVVPVIRDIDRKNVIELAVELDAITAKAREGKLQVEDMRGGNLTVTNAGALGGDTFVPIVNWPEAAILGVARSRTEAVFLDGGFQPRKMLPLALSYDHRLIDGADGVRFMRWLVQALEDPLKPAWEG
jgi:pyruvate dehydrogenase E2 component (dihydrolipoamide acetyltransferase)